jgi:hypothetical protein
MIQFQRIITKAIFSMDIARKLVPLELTFQVHFNPTHFTGFERQEVGYDGRRL